MTTRRLDRPGLPRALLAPMPTASTAVVSVFARAGSAYETAADNGISHLLEHVLVSGSQRYPTRRAVQEAADALGAVVEAYTHRELTEYTLQVLPERLEGAIGLLAECIVRPRISPGTVDEERRLVLEELAATETLQPAGVGAGTGPSELPTVGAAASLRRLGSDDLRALWGEAYDRANLVLAVAGRIDPERVEKALGAFEGLAAGGRERRYAHRPRPPGPRLHLQGEPRGDLVEASLRFEGPGWRDGEPREHVAVAVLVEVLRARLVSRLHFEARPVYLVTVSQETFVTEGWLRVELRCSRRCFAAGFAAARAEIDDLLARGPLAAELEAAKARGATAVLAALDGPRTVAYRLGSDRLLCGEDRSLCVERELELLWRTSSSAVEEVAARRFRGRNLTALVHGAVGWAERRRLRASLADWLPA